LNQGPISKKKSSNLFYKKKHVRLFVFVRPRPPATSSGIKLLFNLKKTGAHASSPPLDAAWLAMMPELLCHAVQWWLFPWKKNPGIKLTEKTRPIFSLVFHRYVFCWLYNFSMSWLACCINWDHNWFPPYRIRYFLKKKDWKDGGW